MRPETLLAELAYSVDEDKLIMRDANQSFRGLIAIEVPIQYGIYDGVGKPTIIDTDSLDELRAEATDEKLACTLEDYKRRLRKNQAVFRRFVTDNFARTSPALRDMMQIEIGWAFFYWCLISRLREANRLPPSLILRVSSTNFGGIHV